MTSGLWVTLVVGGLIGGMGAVAALALPIGREMLGGITSLVGFALSAWSLGRLLGEYRSATTPSVAIALAIGAFIGGYALASSLLPQAARRDEPHAIATATGDRMAVLVLSDAENESYSPALTALELVTLQDDDVLSLGLVTTPFLFAAQKARYRAIGGISPARRQVREIVEALERALVGTDVEYCGLAWCSGAGSLREQVDSLARAGYSRIAVLTLGVGEPLEMARAKLLVDRSRPDEAQRRDRVRSSAAHRRGHPGARGEAHHNGSRCSRPDGRRALGTRSTGGAGGTEPRLR